MIRTYHNYGFGSSFLNEGLLEDPDAGKLSRTGVHRIKASVHIADVQRQNGFSVRRRQRQIRFSEEPPSLRIDLVL